jgi:hypothetical protein
MRIKSGMMVAFSAIFVSIATLFVYLYQARIMQNQLHTSVWPYVEWLYSNGNNQFIITVQNKGIGPAIIRDVTLKLDDAEMGSNSDLFKTLLGHTNFEFVNSTVAGRVILPGESIEMVHVYDSVAARAIDSLLLWDNSKHKLTFELCYCSVYDDCWKTNGTEAVPGQCMEE